ncbi:MAG: CSLREA domain-containing protein [Rubrobacter sp.]|nr:CSLREA domain-containing protein [Rubrobacter sp.]
MNVGLIRAPALALAALLATALLLAALSDPARADTFTVTKTQDTNDGSCLPDDCSLREAVIAANTRPGADEITVPQGTYTLTISGADEDASAYGDLDVASGEVKIQGAGAATTTVSAAGLNDRVFHVLDGAGATISGLTLSGGSPPYDNRTYGRGGGIYNGGTLTLTNSTVSGNTSSSFGGSSFGGGIFNVGTLTLTNSTVSGNETSGYGGGIANGGTLTLDGSTVSDNSANNDGGGISDYGGTLTLTNSTVSGNTSRRHAGGIQNLFGTLTLTNSTVSDNSASMVGGGVYIYDGDTTIENSTITGNTAPEGAGVASLGSDKRVKIDSSIIAANSTTDVYGSFGAYSFDSKGYNVIGDGYATGYGNATDAFDQPGDQTGVEDPGLGPLADNGGPTRTHALLSGSPATDRVATTSCPPPATDQRGTGRPFDGDGDGTPECDSGSFERSPGSVRFGSATYTVDEGAGTATITVVRQDGADGEVTVDYATSDGTASSGSDYTQTSGTLTFAHGDGSKTFAVPINDDTADEPEETVNLTLSNPQGGATLGTQSTATLTITDNDEAPSDTTPPTGAIKINDDALYTRSATADLSLSASDEGSGVTSMRFMNDGGSWSEWEPYATSKRWTLRNANGTRTVYVQYQDQAGNVSESVSDTIILDTVKPTISGMLPKPGTAITDTTPTIRATVRDNLTNLQKGNIKLYVNGVLISPTKWSYNASTDKLTYNSPKLSKGKKTVKIVATDRAGNVGARSWSFTIR